jgi:hypothetical protein
MRTPEPPIDPDRVRRLPAGGFSWVDRRLLQGGWCAALPRDAALLYFFLAAVADSRGVSYYSDRALERLLDLDREALAQSRARLVRLGLILYHHPVYQVLDVPAGSAPVGQRPGGTRRLGERDLPMSLAEVLAEALKRSGPRRGEHRKA